MEDAEEEGRLRSYRAVHSPFHGFSRLVSRIYRLPAPEEIAQCVESSGRIDGYSG